MAASDNRPIACAGHPGAEPHARSFDGGIHFQAGCRYSIGRPRGLGPRGNLSSIRAISASVR